MLSDVIEHLESMAGDRVEGFLLFGNVFLLNHCLMINI